MTPGHAPTQYVILAAVSLAAGAINSVAGGGTLLTFPTLNLLGVSPIVANATNTLGLVPASLSAMWGYRGSIRNSGREMLLLGVPSVIGGVIGALWVVHAGDKLFARLVPWLIFGATALFIAQEPLSRYLRRKREAADPGAATDDVPKESWKRAAIALFQVVVAIYGGFFGAGSGILMLAALGIMGFAGDIHRANGVKNFASACINGVAAATFVILKRIDWPLALLMASAAIIGGYGGAGIAKRLGQATVRNVIIGIGIVIGIVMLVKRP
jgi:uncharacterized membrane protein YfcA